MQRTLLLVILVILLVALIGGTIAFRQLRAAEDTVTTLVEGQQSLLMRERLRDMVLTLDDRSSRLNNSRGRKVYREAVEETALVTEGCKGCHHSADALHLITLITEHLDTARDLPRMVSDPELVRTTLLELRALTESASRTGGDLVERRVEASKERLADGRIIVGGVGIFTLLVLTLSTWWIVRRFRSNLAGVLAATGNLVERGYGSVDWSVFRDEFRIVGNALRTMAERLEAKDRAERDSIRRKLQADRVLALARFAGGIAHEVNNPLTGVVGFADLLLQNPRGLGPEELEYLQRIRESGQRAADIVQTLMRLAHTSAPKPETIRLDQVVGHVVDGILLGMPGAVRGSVNLKLSPALVLADPEQLQQVIFCLVDNAIRAVNVGGGAHGTVMLETFSGENRAVLRVEDTGTGIPDEVMDKVFDPFFTTREVGEGTGLGLAVTRQIVESHGGTISIRSGSGGGTVVEVIFPVAEEPLEPPSPS